MQTLPASIERSLLTSECRCQILSIQAQKLQQADCKIRCNKQTLAEGHAVDMHHNGISKT